MARPLRLEFSGAVYHITARGNARQSIYADDRDRQHFVDLLAKEVSQQRWLCYAWCLMDNHYHLLLETPEPNLIAGMRRLNQVYTQFFNRRHGRTGHVLQGRYKSIIVEKQSHLLELCRYVVLNPVRAGTVQAAHEWRWSSYAATVGSTPAPAWLQAGWVLSNFAASRKAARTAYDRFVAEGMSAKSPWQSLHGQIWLGSQVFRQRMACLVERQALEGIPKTQTRPDRPSKNDVLAAVADAFAIAPDEVLARSHQPAFKTAVYLLRRVCNLALADTARVAGVSPSRVSRIQMNLERGEICESTRFVLNKYKVKL